MNQDEKDAMSAMIPLIRKVLPKVVLARMAGEEPMDVITSEDMWRMCQAVEIGKKYLSKS